MKPRRGRRGTDRPRDITRLLGYGMSFFLCSIFICTNSSYRLQHETTTRATRDRRPKRHVTSLGVWYVFFFLHSIFIGTNSSYRLLQVFLLPFSTDYNSRKPRQRQWRDGEGETAQETRYVSWVWYVFFSSFTFVLSLIHC